jgi:ubiquinone/menaquinone biosynthesis C-methylase UbiE
MNPGDVMTLASRDELQEFYNDSAEMYDQMMDEEIKLPLYGEVLDRLVESIAAVEGPVLDTSCGSGHMLLLLGEKDPQRRPLLGIDIAPKMVAIASKRLGDAAQISLGDMRDLPHIADDSCAAVISFFSLHHIGADELAGCFAEWQRVLVAGGQLLVATWEGEGVIDYGEHSDILTQRYTEAQLLDAITTANLQVQSHSIQPVEEFDMDGLHITATKTVA